MVAAASPVEPQAVAIDTAQSRCPHFYAAVGRFARSRVFCCSDNTDNGRLAGHTKRQSEQKRFGAAARNAQPQPASDFDRGDAGKRRQLGATQLNLPFP